MIFALIPAGGKSVRMGRPKLALPLGNRSVLARVIESLLRAGIEHNLVVIGPHAAELVPLASAAGAYAHLLSQETPDMRATVEQGLRWLEDRFEPAADDAWLLVPADHPTLDADVVQQLVQARAANPRTTILIPTFQGQRGHPALIGWNHVPGIRALAAGQGLNTYFRQRAAETLEVPVANRDILSDLDTPDDYERLRRNWPGAPLE